MGIILECHVDTLLVAHAGPTDTNYDLFYQIS